MIKTTMYCDICNSQFKDESAVTELTMKVTESLERCWFHHHGPRQTVRHRLHICPNCAVKVDALLNTGLSWLLK